MAARITHFVFQSNDRHEKREELPKVPEECILRSRTPSLAPIIQLNPGIFAYTEEECIIHSCLRSRRRVVHLKSEDFAFSLSLLERFNAVFSEGLSKKNQAELYHHFYEFALIQQNFEEAENFIKKAIVLHPQKVVHHEAYLRFLSRHGTKEKLQLALEQAIKMCPLSIRALQDAAEVAGREPTPLVKAGKMRNSPGPRRETVLFFNQAYGELVLGKDFQKNLTLMRRLFFEGIPTNEMIEKALTLEFNLGNLKAIPEIIKILFNRKLQISTYICALVLRYFEKIGASMEERLIFLDIIKKNIEAAQQWKLHLFKAQLLVQDRKLLESCRLLCQESYESCPPHLKYLPICFVAQIERAFGYYDLFTRHMAGIEKSIPPRKAPHFYLLWARHAESNGEREIAAQLFEKCLKTFHHDWKAHYEAIFFEVRKHNLHKARALLKVALEKFPKVVHIAHAAIHLAHDSFDDKSTLVTIQKNADKIMALFEGALKAIPRGGALYCSLAAFLMNPHTNYFNLDRAAHYLKVAQTLTPQLGDIYIELRRLQLLRHPGENISCQPLMELAAANNPTHGLEWQMAAYPHRTIGEIFKRAELMMLENMASTGSSIVDYFKRSRAFGPSWTSWPISRQASHLRTLLLHAECNLLNRDSFFSL